MGPIRYPDGVVCSVVRRPIQGLRQIKERKANRFGTVRAPLGRLRQSLGNNVCKVQ
ncbi:MAG TPA: hypothetical protein VLE46_08155 [Nitrospira sp.]|nr:hypothetical protein [Nitrospira sp.]